MIKSKVSTIEWLSVPIQDRDLLIFVQKIKELKDRKCTCRKKRCITCRAKECYDDLETEISCIIDEYKNKWDMGLYEDD